jgi:Tfp pilus assembly protein PilZ
VSRKDAEPVRLKVAYKTPQALLSEFTRSVGKGGVAIASRKSAPVGTQFIFELRAKGMPEVVEVHGEVMSAAPQSGGMFLLNIRYQQPNNRDGLDGLLRRIFEAQKYEKVRKFPRVPLQLHATEDKANSIAYLVRDISAGGLGIEIEAPETPKWVKKGAPVFLELVLSLGTLALHGEVVWVVNPPPERQKLVNPGFGVQFGKLRADTVERLDKILTFRGLPPPPWKAKISFGMDAVSRMP